MDTSLNKLSEDWGEIRELVLFGFGSVASRYVDKFSKEFHIPFIIDNSPQKQGQDYNGIPIVSLDAVKEKLHGYKVVIMAETRAYRNILKMLEKAGFTENTDFSSLEQFVTEWYWRFRQKACLLEIHTAVTTKCTFNCLHCNMFVPYYDVPRELSFDEMKQTLDLFFNLVDYVYCYTFVGGEPFTNKNFLHILEYLCRVYRDKTGLIRIVTNGSIIPDRQLLDVISRYKIEINISDYSEQIPYRDRLDQVTEALNRKNIAYHIIPSLTWRNFGFPVKPCCHEKVRDHMISCGTSWHGLTDKRLYYCNVAWSAEMLGLFRPDAEDYVSLEELSPDRGEDRQKLLELTAGNFSKGYHSFCKLCGGCGEDNPNFVKAGIQMKRR